MHTSITLTFKGKTLTIDKMVIDTGASHTLLSADIVADLGVYFENHDEIINAFGIGGEEVCFRKTFEKIQLGTFHTKNIKLDVGTLHEQWNINGLIGLDLLKEANMMIDLKQMKMYAQ